MILAAIGTCKKALDFVELTDETKKPAREITPGQAFFTHFFRAIRLVTYNDAAGLMVTAGAAQLSRGIGLGGLRQRSCLFLRSGLGRGLRRGGCTRTTAAATSGFFAAAGVAATGVAASAAALLCLVEADSQAAKIFKEVEHRRATRLAAACATISFAALGPAVCLAALGCASCLAALGLGSTGHDAAGFGLAA